MASVRNQTIEAVCMSKETPKQKERRLKRKMGLSPIQAWVLEEDKPRIKEIERESREKANGKSNSDR